MKVLILGGSGMLGHKLWQIFSPRFNAYVTFRDQPSSYGRFGIFDRSRIFGEVTAENLESVERVLATVLPDAVVNCIGIVKQHAAAKDPATSITVNSLFPHLLARACSNINARLIHLSTDCVFSGRKGNYAEADVPDAEDLYGRTKLLGEVSAGNCLTIRTSMIGRELEGNTGLLEWVLSQQGSRIRGFKRAVFSGFTTVALARVLAEIVSNHPNLHGVWHVAAEPINKFDLLSLIKGAYRLEVEIEPDENFVCDRSLDGSRFHAVTGMGVPSWPEMITDMRNDKTPYEEIRRVHAQR